MANKDSNKKITLEEYQKKHSRPVNEKAAKSFLFIFTAAIGLLVAFLLFSVVIKLYDINKYAGYASIPVAVLVYIFIYIAPLIKLKKTKPFITNNVNSNNVKEVKRYNKKLREDIADKMIDLSQNTNDAPWYSEEKIGKLAIARQTNNDDMLKDNLTLIYKTDVNDAANKMIRSYAFKVGRATAISQNEKLDSLFVIAYDLTLIKNLVYLYGFRPSDSQLAKIYRNVLVDTLIAYGLSNVTGNLATSGVKSLGKAVNGVPILGAAIATVADSIAQGIINSTLSVIIGFQTKKYLMKEYHLQDVLDNVIIPEEELTTEESEMTDSLKEEIKKIKKGKDEKVAA